MPAFWGDGVTADFFGAFFAAGFFVVAMFARVYRTGCLAVGRLLPQSGNMRAQQRRRRSWEPGWPSRRVRAAWPLGFGLAAALEAGPAWGAETATPATPTAASTEPAAPAEPAEPPAPAKPADSAPKPAPKGEPLGSQQDDRKPIEEGFGKRWLVAPTVSSNPKLSTSFGVTGLIFLRFDDSVSSVIAIGGAYSVSNSWTAFAFGKFNFLHDRERVLGGVFRGHAANSYDDFMDQGIALESTSNVMAAPVAYFHRLGPREATDWWVGGQAMYVRLDQSGEDPTSSTIISSLGLDGSDAMAFGPNALLDSRDNQNSPTRGQRLFVRTNLWAQLDPPSTSPFFVGLGASYSYYLPLPYLVLALHANARFTFDAPLIFRSSLSRFRAYTVGEQLAAHTMSVQAEARIPFGHTRFGAAAFGGLATLFDDFSELGTASTYYPMLGAGLRAVLNEQQKSIIRLEYAQGINDARGIYLAMGQAFQ